MELNAGDTIDRFTIVERLGGGGMGDVYRAHDSRLARDVALKILRTGPDNTSNSKLLREAQMAAALEHPNVVAVYDVAEAQTPEVLSGTPYMTMELIEGRRLRDCVRDPSIRVEQRVAWLTDVARALAAAHRRALVHRDVKPANVMIRSDGQVKVLDFGVARKLGTRVDPNAPTRTETNSATPESLKLVGTPAYMAPEQLRGESVDGRTDQFAWGVMAYELLSGKRPWASELDTIHLVAEILSREPIPPSTYDPEISPSVSNVVMRALSKEPDQRFATMDDLIVAIASNAPVAHAPEPVRESTRPPKTSVTVAWKVILPIVVVAPLLGFLGHRAFRAPESQGSPSSAALAASSVASASSAPAAPPSDSANRATSLAAFDGGSSPKASPSPKSKPPVPTSSSAKKPPLFFPDP